MSFVNVKDFKKLEARVTELMARVQALETFHQPEPAAEKKAEPIPDIEVAIEEEESGTTPGSNPLEDLFGTKIALLLIGDDLDTVDKVDQASDERLRSINGIGAATVKNIREGLEKLWAR